MQSEISMNIIIFGVPVTGDSDIWISDCTTNIVHLNTTYLDK